MISKCPKCESTFTSLVINGLNGQVPGGKAYNCITLCCPHCRTVLSAQIDPVAIRNDILQAIDRSKTR